MTRVALYARFSTDIQREGSINAQLEMCGEYAVQRGWKVVKTYSDVAVSGPSVLCQPGIRALLRDARRGLFELVLTEALDRISRAEVSMIAFFKELKVAGVKIATLVDETEAASSTIRTPECKRSNTSEAMTRAALYAAEMGRGIRAGVESGKIRAGARRRRSRLTNSREVCASCGRHMNDGPGSGQLKPWDQSRD
jgi:DNA invertase Pin-like site-specific DNA recombinase